MKACDTKPLMFSSGLLSAHEPEGEGNFLKIHCMSPNSNFCCTVNKSSRPVLVNKGAYIFNFKKHTPCRLKIKVLFCHVIRLKMHCGIVHSDPSSKHVFILSSKVVETSHHRIG